MDKIAAEAAHKIAEYFGGTKESTAFYDAHGPFMSSVIQSALSQSLAEREQRIAELRDALQECLGALTGGNFSDPITKARAALAATEESKP